MSKADVEMRTKSLSKLCILTKLKEKVETELSKTPPITADTNFERECSIFTTWLSRTYAEMKLYELPKSELREFDQEGVSECYETLMSKMERAVDRKKIPLIKEQELDALIVKQEEKGKKILQMHKDRILHGQPQGLNTHVYAPIDDIKSRIVK